MPSPEHSTPDGSEFEAPTSAEVDVPEAVESEAVAEAVVTPEREAENVAAHELLSNSETYRMGLREKASNFLTDVQHKVASTKNAASTPKAIVLEIRRDMARYKYQRISEKQDKSRFEFVNNRRDRKAAAAYDKLQDREDALSGQEKKMAGRHEQVDMNAVERMKDVEVRRKELAEDKIAAMERKVIREQQRERRQALRSEKLSHSEREAQVKAFIDGRKKQIRAAAIKAIQRDVALGDINYGLT